MPKHRPGPISRRQLSATTTTTSKPTSTATTTPKKTPTKCNCRPSWRVPSWRSPFPRRRWLRAEPAAQKKLPYRAGAIGPRRPASRLPATAVAGPTPFAWVNDASLLEAGSGVDRPVGRSLAGRRHHRGGRAGHRRGDRLGAPRPLDDGVTRVVGSEGSFGAGGRHGHQLLQREDCGTQ